VAQQTPHNLVDRSGAVLAAGVSAAARCLVAEELRPPHQTTIAGEAALGVKMEASKDPFALKHRRWRFDNHSDNLRVVQGYVSVFLIDKQPTVSRCL
jgi:hypothetical protein